MWRFQNVFPQTCLNSTLWLRTEDELCIILLSSLWLIGLKQGGSFTFVLCHGSFRFSPPFAISVFSLVIFRFPLHRQARHYTALQSSILALLYNQLRIASRAAFMFSEASIRPWSHNGRFQYTIIWEISPKGFLRRPFVKSPPSPQFRITRL